jgi:hypothetical protein
VCTATNCGIKNHFKTLSVMIASTQIARQLYDYIFDQKGFEMVTRNNITIEAEDNFWLRAEYKFVDTEETSLGVNFYCEMKQFVHSLKIKRLWDVYALTTDCLLNLYHEGLADMVCWVNFINASYVMNFQKSGQEIIATNSWNVKHTIPRNEILETPDQFIAYTRRYYKLMECNEN